MQYKTIVLELLEQRPEIRQQFERDRVMLTMLDRYAEELKASHEAWKEHLHLQRPGSDPSQIASEALELALEELQSRLPSESPRDEPEPLSLDAAMAFLRRHTLPE